MATQGERLAAVEQRIADHEGRCEERLAEIKADIKGAADKIDRLVWAAAGFGILTLAGLVLRGAGLG